MTHMTPDDARRILAGVKKGDGFSLHGEWCDALKALAADILEYGVVDAAGDIDWFTANDTMPAEDARLAAVNYANSDQFFRLVCRRVSQPWDSEGTTLTEQRQAEMDEQWRLLRDHNAEAWHVLDEVMHAKAKGRKTVRIDNLLGDTDA